MTLDPVLLSRLQFALTVSFHYLFPPLTIGLGVLMVIMEAMYLRTRDRHYEVMARFWTSIFAMIFVMGVASGIVMEFQFGTNWATYSRFVGDVFGPALAAEGIFAFFLESVFLGILVFGWDRVGPRTHFFSTLMVCVGSILSAFWIIVANSWQQTPAGFHLVGAGPLQRAEVADFWAAVFNPSTIHRLSHTLLGAFVAGGFLVVSVCAWYLLKGRNVEFARRGMRIALPFVAIASLGTLVSGHPNAQMVATHQPPKLAAFEGVFQTGPGGTPMYLFGLPDVDQMRVRYGLAIPGLLSLLAYGDPDTPVQGLDTIPRDEWPPVRLSFQAYHGMVALGMFFIVLSAYAFVVLRRGTLENKRWLLRLLVLTVILPVVANELGWIAAEVGRQPWVVWGLLRTSQAVSRSVSAEQVLVSILAFGGVYLALLLLWLYLLGRKIGAGPPAADLANTAAAPADAASPQNSANDDRN
jgi:cytochrome d ubiquinol oxidase subunit I